MERNMKIKNLLPIMSMLFLLATGAMVQAKTYPMPPLPKIPNIDWVPGSSMTYHVVLNDGPDTGTFDLRFAILGSEKEATTNTKLYDLEIDITHITWIPEEMKEYFMMFYGELPTDIRMVAKMPKYDLTLFVTDPSKCYKDLCEIGFIRKYVVQYNRQVPEDVDPTLIATFSLPAMAAGAIDDLPEDFRDNNNLGIKMMQDPKAFKTENSESTRTTPAGTFSGHLFSFTSEDNPSGEIFFTGSTPILPVVTGKGNWIRGSKKGDLDMELTSIEKTGAQTEIVGEPKRENYLGLSS
jgi:hypothetical protein